MSLELTDDAKVQLGKGHCPACGYRGFILGPRGGVAINIECGNLDCRARYNVVPYGGVMLYAETIDREAEGGANWNDTPPAGAFKGTRS